MRAWLIVVLAACGGGGHGRPDSGGDTVGTDAPIDAPPTPPVPGQIVVWLQETGPGVGTGRVTSSPAGIDCATMLDPQGIPQETRCAAMFDGSVTLTATADPGFVFAGWNAPGCGTSPTCTLTTQFDPVTAFAYFLPAGYHVVTFTGGTALSDVQAQAVLDPNACQSASTCSSVTARCHAPCMLPVPDGWSVSIAGSTPSVLNGISGACTSATAFCTFTPTADATVSIDTMHDSHELLAITLPIPNGDENVGITGVDVDSQDHIVIVTASSFRKLDASGATLWAKPFQGPGRVRIAADDHIVVHTATTLSRWNPDGTMEWSRDVKGTPLVSGPFLAVSPTGDIAVIDPFDPVTGVSVFDATGAPRWTATTNDSEMAVSVGPDASIWVASHVNDSLFGYAADGTPLSTLMFVVPDAGSCVGLSVDANGFVASAAGEFKITELERHAWDGSGVFADQPDDGAFPNTYEAPNAIASDGGVWWAYATGDTAAGYHLRHYDASGSQRFLITRADSTNAYLMRAHDLRPLSQGRVVLVGYYGVNRLGILPDDVLDGGFIQIFGP